MKPDDIPQDVWDVSFNIADEWEEFDPLCIDMAKDIAVAILAERERCAKIADYFCESAYSEGMSEDVVMARSYTAGDIAAAIRKG